MRAVEILRYTAFSTDPGGGNPAGVVLDATGATDAEMLAVAAAVGYSETAFLFPDGSVRYFSPLAEVPFCGHATIAAAVAYTERHGPGLLALQTRNGRVDVATSLGPDGRPVATLTSVPPRVIPIEPDDFDTLLAALSWKRPDLDPTLPPCVAFAGVWHPIVAAATRQRLAELDYDFDALGELMAARDWTTVNLIFRESEQLIHARNPFPPGGVVEDPATGAAAAALGGYLRELGLVDAPATITIRQGEDMGRPGLLAVNIPAERGSGIAVTGGAVRLPA